MAVYMPTPDSDLVTLQECSALFGETGHPASVTTLKRWIGRRDILTDRQGRAQLVSFAVMLQVHKEEIAKRV